MIKEAIVLCGGQGTRLHPVVPDVPKALAPVCGRPMLDYILMDLYAQGIERVVLATGYGHDQIVSAVATNLVGERDMEIDFSREPRPLGTGGALRLALDKTIGQAVVVVNGDTFSEMNVRKMFRYALGRNTSIIWTARRPTACPELEMRVRVDEISDTGTVTAIEYGYSGPINGGAYLFIREHLEMMVSGMPYSLEDDVLPSLAATVKLTAVNGLYPLLDIGTPERYAAAQDFESCWKTICRCYMVARHLRDARFVLQLMLEPQLLEAIDAAAFEIALALKSGGKVLVCGNGGSAAEAQHLAAELMGRLKPHSQRGPLPAIALTADPVFLTAQANDVGFESVFARQVEALGRPGDVLIAISTSGKSPNVLQAMDAAAKVPMGIIAMGGPRGFHTSHPRRPIDIPFSPIMQQATMRSQEAHLVVIHVLCDLIEQYLKTRNDNEA